MVRPIHVSLVRVCIVPSQGYDAGYACVSRSRLLADEMPHLAARLNGEFFLYKSHAMSTWYDIYHQLTLHHLHL